MNSVIRQCESVMFPALSSYYRCNAVNVNCCHYPRLHQSVVRSARKTTCIRVPRTLPNHCFICGQNQMHNNLHVHCLITSLISFVLFTDVFRSDALLTRSRSTVNGGRGSRAEQSMLVLWAARQASHTQDIPFSTRGSAVGGLVPV